MWCAAASRERFDSEAPCQRPRYFCRVMSPQPGILLPPPPAGRFLTFELIEGDGVGDIRRALSSLRIDDSVVIGLGLPTVKALGATVPGLVAFEPVVTAHAKFPATQGALWAFVRGDDPGHALHGARALSASLATTFRVVEDVASFVFAKGRDLSGYEDGTENPKGKKAVAAALVSKQGAAFDGGSFVSVQRWVHDLNHFESMTGKERDHAIGRSQKSNKELAHAPASAHVKRAAQESFMPEAFMVRRSMPYGTVGEHGLYFVAYASSLSPFTQVLHRMSGAEDGIPDALLTFTHAVSGAHYFCPPRHGPHLRLP